MKLDHQKYWDDRIVYNGWNTLGNLGAKLYLEKYGNGISNEKLEALAELCRYNNAFEMASGFIAALTSPKQKPDKKESVLDRTWEFVGGISVLKLDGFYTVNQSELKNLIKQNIYKKDENGRPLLPTHDRKIKLKSSDFVLVDDKEWVSFVDRTKYVIIKDII